MSNSVEGGFMGAHEAQEATEQILRRLEGRQMKKALLPAARVLFNKARALAPYDETRARGKHLRDALFIDARTHASGETNVLVGVNHRKAPHAHLMEYGWEKKPGGIPFMRPAAIQAQETVRREVKAALDTLIMGKFRDMWE